MLSLPQTLTQKQATVCLRDLRHALRGHDQSCVELDARALNQFDSAALAVLLALRRDVLALNKSLVVRAMPTRLADLAAVYGIDELLCVDACSPVK